MSALAVAAILAPAAAQVPVPHVLQEGESFYVGGCLVEVLGCG